MKNYAKLSLIPTALSLLLFQSVFANAASVEKTELTAEQRQILIKQAKGKIKLFAGDLKATLKQGMKSKGPVEAINLCNVQAPAIASVHSEGDWTISRTSLKVRNTDNAASDWQYAILQDFEQRKGAGESAKAIATSLVREGSFYFVKAIPTGPICTTCHGKLINSKVTAKLSELYPDDKADGFDTGDIRGAFVVSKKLSSKN